MQLKKLVDYSQPAVAATTVFVIGLCIIVGYTTVVIRDIAEAGNTIEVTGSAKEAVVADMGRLVISIETKTGLTDQAAGTDRVQAAVDRVTAYLNQQQLSQFETPAGSVSATYYYPERGEAVQTGYTLQRAVIVRSEDIEKLTTLANNTGPLSGDGYTVTSNGLELTYTKLDEMRVKLLTAAIKDATDRANAIAQNSGRTVGQLQNAVGGVVQVLPAGGVDISDYGSYDTASVNKEVMVTTRATFQLE